MQQSACPRCNAPVGGDFRFCPECACRLQAGPPDVEDEAPRSGLGGLLVLLFCSVGLLAAGYLVGRMVFGTEPTAATTRPLPSTRPLTAEDIQDSLVLIGPGIASYRKENVEYFPPLDEALQHIFEAFAAEGGPDFLEGALERPAPLSRWSRFVKAFDKHTASLVRVREKAIPVRTEAFRMMIHEVSRGQYAQFLRSVRSDPSVLAEQDFVRNLLWRPPVDNPDGQEYSRYYRELWWLRVAEHHRLREDRTLERPLWFDQHGLSNEQGVLLLTPPSWVRVDEFGGFSWEVEPGTENLPVTEISWWDAHMFTVWARKALSISTLWLPNAAQWVRAFHSNHPRRPPDDYDEKGDDGWFWPWGSQYDPHGCNNLNASINAGKPELRDVRQTYYWHEGKTADGVLNMAGNAAEWVDNWEPIRLDDKTAGPYHPRTNEYRSDGSLIRKAYTAGGSYLSGIDDCKVDLNATLDKCDRQSHVGFRLIMTLGLGG